MHPTSNYDKIPSTSLLHNKGDKPDQGFDIHMPKTFIASLMTMIILFSLTATQVSSTTESQVTDLSPSDIVAETAVVIDADTLDVYFDKKSNRQMSPASITKLMTALLVIEAKEMTDTMTFSENAIKSLEYGSSSIGIRVEETLTVDQAMHGLLLMSANETANALAEEVSGSIDAFVASMNERALNMGLENTNFTNPHGLHDDLHYTSAYDMAVITSEVLESNAFMNIMGTSMYQIHETNKCEEIRYLAQQHKMLNDKNDMRIYREDVIAGKVGYTSESGHTLVTVASNGDRTIIVVIMNSEGKKQYDDTEKLIEYGYLSEPIVHDEPEPTTLDEAETTTPDPIENQEAKVIVTVQGDNLDTSSGGNQLTIGDIVEETEPDNYMLKNILIGLAVLLVVAILGFLVIQDTARRRRLNRKRDRFHNLKL